MTGVYEAGKFNRVESCLVYILLMWKNMEGKQGLVFPLKELEAWLTDYNNYTILRKHLQCRELYHFLSGKIEINFVLSNNIQIS